MEKTLMNTSLARFLAMRGEPDLQEYFFAGASESELSIAEHALGKQLPAPLRQLLTASNGAWWPDSRYGRVVVLATDRLQAEDAFPTDEDSRIFVATSLSIKVRPLYYSNARFTFAYSDKCRFQLDYIPTNCGEAGQIVVIDTFDETIDVVAPELFEFVVQGLSSSKVHSSSQIESNHAHVDIDDPLAALERAGFGLLNVLTGSDRSRSRTHLGADVTQFVADVVADTICTTAGLPCSKSRSGKVSVFTTPGDPYFICVEVKVLFDRWLNVCFGYGVTAGNFPRDLTNYDSPIPRSIKKEFVVVSSEILDTGEAALSFDLHSGEALQSTKALLAERIKMYAHEVIEPTFQKARSILPAVKDRRKKNED